MVHDDLFVQPDSAVTGRGLSLAPGVRIPSVIQKALDSSPSSRKSSSNRDSLQRKRYWWLPYVVLEFDKNEVLIDALGGDLASPIWNYRADLCVALLSYTIHLGLMTILPAMCHEHQTSQYHLTCVRR